MRIVAAVALGVLASCTVAPAQQPDTDAEARKNVSGDGNGQAEKEAPVFTEVEPYNLKWLKLEGEFAGITPARMFELWTRPELLTKWWPPRAEIELKVGGKYELSWLDGSGEVKWQLAAKITEFEPNRRLGFTWDWAGSENPNHSTVSIEFIETEGGANLRVTHGPYTESDEDQNHRRSQLGGWQFFGANLRKMRE